MEYPKWLEKKLVEWPRIEAKAEELRKKGKTIATLNGSFDLLHAGHLYILDQAKRQADCLWVALNSDASIRSYKDPSRPIVSLPHRLSMMAALSFVDWVSWFDETDPREFLKKVVPDVHVNGAEYGTDCIEGDLIKAQGGRLHLVDRIPSLSTSEIIQKVQHLCV